MNAPSQSSTDKSARVWRSVEEWADTTKARELLEREFPEISMKPVDEVRRRTFLKMMGAALALAGVNGCTRQPIEQIVPYVRQPEEIVPGEPLYFATAMPLGGYGTPILVKSREGRPIKADGNPQHPASGGGGSSVWVQACLLDLYNPERARSVTHFGESSSFGLFASALNDLLQAQRGRGGRGIRILTGSVTSPSLAAQLLAVLKAFPEARWHQWEPINLDNSNEGARLAFGETLATQHRIANASVIVSFDSDFLYTHPERLRYTREFTDGRRVVAGRAAMNRLYSLESTPTVTGSMADHRLPISGREIDGALRFLASELELGMTTPGHGELTETQKKWLSAMARDLQAHQGASLVIVSETLHPSLHLLGQRINEKLGNFGRTVLHTTPAQAEPVNHGDSLKKLCEDMANGSIEALLILGGNPVFDAPADCEFGARLKNVKHAVHLSPEFSETSALCEWHIPETHFLETWSDIRSFDGTVMIMQPLIAPFQREISA